MKIRDKLFLGFGLVSMTALGIGVMSMVNVDSVNQRALNIYDEALMVVSFSKSATIDFYIIEGLYQQAAAIAPDDREDHLELIEDETEVFFEDLDVVKERSGDSRIHETLPLVTKHFQQWKTHKDQWLGNIFEVEEGEASSPLSEQHSGALADIAETRRHVQEDLMNIVDFATESGFTMRVESEEQGKAMLTMTMALTGLALLLGGFVAWFTARPIVRRVNQIGGILEITAQGDFSSQSDVNTQDEIGTMSIHLNEMSATLATVLGEVRETVEQVSAASTQISAGNEDLSQRTSEQASALAETSSSMEEITSIVKQNAESAKHANQLALSAREVAEKGGKVTDRAIGAMDEINKSSKKIADIINVIDEIAFQTNLLALNAAVEAARAGEQGRGFAVVAAEVRSLAQRSAVSAKEIKELIHESVEKVSDGSQLVNESGKTLEEIVNSVKRVTDIIAEISVASDQQTGGIEQVNESILKMDGTTQQNAALVEEVSASAQSMRTQASHLMEQIAFFKLTGSQELDESVLDVTPPPSGVGNISTNQKTTLSVQDQKKTGSSTSKNELASLSAGNGHDRRNRTDDVFEEF